MSPDERSRLSVGERISVTIEKIAHGGHSIARHNGAVIFIRHGIPGEKCTVEITSVGASFNRADVVLVEQPSPDRVTPPCRYAHRSGCGGCDFQHISPTRQRALKADVITEQFSRIAKLDIHVEVVEVGKSLGWRTRCTTHTSRDGKLGFYKARSHDVVEIDDCLILNEQLGLRDLASKQYPVDSTIEITGSSSRERTVSMIQNQVKERVLDGPQILHYPIAGLTLEAHHQSFWQSHQAAPHILTEAVSELAEIKVGDEVLDLYGGVGLFTAVLLSQIGTGGLITLVEGSKKASADATRNFKDFNCVKVVNADVAKALPRISGADVIVLDPPREGVDTSVITEFIRLHPRRIVYVSCDPASLARDARALQDSGYPLTHLRGYDLFPMTHHIECVALFTPDKVS